jgi:aminoglycoside/choline kinase family phosphotransferase
MDDTTRLPHVTDRKALITGFLAQAGWDGAARRKLAGDASFRHYDRLAMNGSTAVLMDAPPPHEDVRPFLAVTRLLQGLDLSAPRVLAENVEAGLLLLEDFGDGTFTRRLAAGDDEQALYTLAVDLLILLHRRFEPTGTDLPSYDEPRLLAEAALLVDWYLPAIRGTPTPPALRDSYFAAWRRVLPLAGAAPTTLVLRDNHVDNMMVLPDRGGIAGCGLLDYQDAVLGPASYDLVSLLEDARRDVPPALAAAMKARYIAAFPNLDRAGFAASYAVLGAQRSCKIIGIFTRLCVRDGKPTYLAHIPRVWRLVEQDLRHPALAPVAGWLEEHLPPEERRTPPKRRAS